MNTTTAQLLKTLLAEIASDEAAIASKRFVADFLQLRLKLEGGIGDSPTTLVTPKTSALARNELLTHAASSESFLESVTKAVEVIYHEEFTVSDVFAVLVAKGVKFNSSTPKASISTALGRLLKTGVLHLVYKGAGKTPNRYLRAYPIADSKEKKEENL